MIDTGDGESIDEKEQFEDRAIKSFRAIVQEKKDISGQKRVMTFLYTASTFLVMVVLVIGITLINNYEKMEGLEMALSDISRTLESQEAEEALAETENVDAGPTAAEPTVAEPAAAEVQPAEEAEQEAAEKPEQEAAGETEREAAGESEQGSGEESGQEEPKAAEQEEPQQEAQEAAAEDAIPEIYTVQKGDTLLGISRRIYGRDDQIDAICSLNGIDDSDRILAGQKLLLP